MISVSLEEMEKQVECLTNLSKTPNIIYFDEFVNSIAPLYKMGEMPDEVRVAKDEDSLLKGDYEPAYRINIKDNINLLNYKGLPMWHNLSNDQLSLHGLGLIDGNRSAPSKFTLYDTNPHGNIGGATGHGKSVLANAIIMTASLVHPPWKAQFYLSDPKITEMKPYATSDYKIPHVDAVAATEDPEYAISVLEYLLAKMDKRASIFNNVKVKNIDGFNKAGVGLNDEEKAYNERVRKENKENKGKEGYVVQKEIEGLQMPMMILVLDELKAMLQTAGRRSAHVDKLIQAFVAKARFAGGRCIMLSQGVVTELDPATMKNVNIRVALGCTPAESEKLVGNPGAAVNLGSMGKITYNDTPMKTLKENTYLVTPFLPDKANDNTNNIYDIFEYQHKVWEKLTSPSYRISPLSFFDQTAPLTKEEFEGIIDEQVDKGHIFLGEPVYINKSKYPMAFTSFNPLDKYSDNLSNNLLFFSQFSKHRLNFLATLLTNFDKLRRVRDLDLRIYSPLNQTNEVIKSLGFEVDGYDESADVSEAFARIVTQALTKILLVKTDEIVFSNRDEDFKPKYKPLLEQLEKDMGPLSTIMKRRLTTFMDQLQDQQPQLVFGLGGEFEEKKNLGTYYSYAEFMVYYYEDFGCKNMQLTAENTPVDVRVFFNYHLLNGVEVKKNRMLDMWMNVVRMAPVYGIHFILISDMLPNSGSELNGSFNKIVFYYPTNNAIAQQKLTDDYPPSTLECLYIYADKTKTTNKCVKVKLVEMLDLEETG